MKFLRIRCQGSVNSFRQPDFHTYHKTLPLPPKTTIAGMLGSALGISPREVNDEWLIKKRFSVGIAGRSEGKANDLWQIRKYKASEMKRFDEGKAPSPYITAVIVRELLFFNDFTLYFNFTDKKDFKLISKALENPSWALSLGREDELILIKEIKVIELLPKDNLVYKNTILPYDITDIPYAINNEDISHYGINIMDSAPTTVNLPITFQMDGKSEVRQPMDFQNFTYVHNISVIPEIEGYWDDELQIAFQPM